MKWLYPGPLIRHSLLLPGNLPGKAGRSTLRSALLRRAGLGTAMQENRSVLVQHVRS